MKAHLTFADADFDVTHTLPQNADDLTQDLGLDALLEAMASGDPLLLDVARHAIFSLLTEPIQIRYRQDALKDALANPLAVKDLYAIAVDAINAEKKTYWGYSVRHPSSILRIATGLLRDFVPMLHRLRAVADANAGTFSSQAFITLFATLQSELSDEYFETVDRYLKELAFHEGVLLSARLGEGNVGTGYVLRKFEARRHNWLERIFGAKERGFTFRIHPRDERGSAALAALNDKGVNPAANVLAQAADHILGFFTLLRTELAFYIGCLNLEERLMAKSAPTCFPVPSPAGERKRSLCGLYDPGLALNSKEPVVGNDLDTGGKNLVVITGANRGGKSTFLRGVGAAQLMMQAGMFVPASSFAADVVDAVFTHYEREEDTDMESGKLDEELARASEIMDRITPYSLALFNESFAATNEREGSEIAKQVVRALTDAGVTSFFVTHLYDFARDLYADAQTSAVFLRAERKADGSRTFKLIAGEPLETSYGEDLYARIFRD